MGTFAFREGGYVINERNQLQENSRILFHLPGFEIPFGRMV